MTIPSTYNLSLSEKVSLLITQQKKDWPLFRDNLAGMDKIESRNFSFGEFQITAQFNPERIRSSAAKTDDASIRERPCFLCEKNRPKEQQGVDFKGRYTILVNPFPIFPEHLTIPLNEHLPQSIMPYFPDMLQLSRELPGFTLFYNGPQSGASAPDHFHFQAGTKMLMPAEREIGKITGLYGGTLYQDDQIKMQWAGKEYLRKFICMTSASAPAVIRHFMLVLTALEKRGQKDEPMMNILSGFENGSWKIVIFPRDRQRPRQFFEQGEKQIMMSPASVEFGGLAILPRKEDFDKLSHGDLADIYSQVTINDTAFNELMQTIRSNL
ncbi:MAG: DUF4922 domain-containing protein [Prolixibacteraceae bacterium]